MNKLNISHFQHHIIPAVNKGMTDGSKWMIVMHGLGDQLDSFIPLCHEINVTGLNYLLINAPHPYPVGSSWYDLEPVPYGKLEQSRALLKNLIKELNDQGISSEDLFLMGFSQGGLMAIDQFLHSQQVFGGIVALSPRVNLPDNYSDLLYQEKLKTPFFVGHGSYDAQIDFEETESQVMKLQEEGLRIEFHSYSMEHSISIEEIQDLRNWLNSHL